MKPIGDHAMMYLSGHNQNHVFPIDCLRITPHGGMIALVAYARQEINCPNGLNRPDGRYIGQIVPDESGFRPLQEILQDPAFLSIRHAMRDHNGNIRREVRIMTAIIGPEWKTVDRWTDQNTHYLS